MQLLAKEAICCVLKSLFHSGILPFGAVFIELYFIFNALWQHQFYYLFGFLFLVFIILVVSCAQIAVVLVYFQVRVQCPQMYLLLRKMNLRVS